MAKTKVIVSNPQDKASDLLTAADLLVKNGYRPKIVPVAGKFVLIRDYQKGDESLTDAHLTQAFR